MKRIIVSAALLLLAAMTLSAFAGCASSKTAITAADFKAKAEAAGLTVEDMSDTYTDKIFTGSQMAVSTDGWKVVFFTIDTEENAKAYYGTMKEFCVSQKTGAGTAQTTDRDTWGSYSQTNGGMFMYVGWIGSTMVYASVEEAHKAAVQEFVSGLGY